MRHAPQLPPLRPDTRPRVLRFPLPAKPTRLVAANRVHVATHAAGGGTIPPRIADALERVLLDAPDPALLTAIADLIEFAAEMGATLTTPGAR